MVPLQFAGNSKLKREGKVTKKEGKRIKSKTSK